MSDIPIPMAAIEHEAGERLNAEPLFEVENGKIDVGGLEEELAVLEQGAEDQYNAGAIPRETRLGILIAVAGLRDSIEKAQGGGERA